MLVPVPSSPHLSHREHRLPDKRWAIAERDLERVEAIVQATQLSPLLAQVLTNRGIASPGQAEIFLDPDLQVLPSPLEDFPDLAVSVELLQEAIANQHKIAICGDYDADGMTSTALLLRALRALGAEVDYAIPSRMSEGYGINERIVEDFHREGVRLILTVDNGIAAVKPIARARELGLAVIVTDHHEVPPEIPPANAILNPKLIHEDSPYRGVAGVGVAYVLAVTLAQQLDAKDLGNLLLELFTLGTIADLAPLTGVNRRWVKRGLQRLPKSQIPGVQALIQVAGLGSSKALKPEAIGFSLGPRINAVGRIADPQVVIELLTTDDMGIALERAMQCEQINQHRQQLCTQIEREAIAWYEASEIDLQDDRVLVIVQPNWHHGVIGIVASRLVERYGVPVFIGTYEDDNQKIRGSARSIPDFHVFEALEFCKEVLEKHGGHQAAGGFTLLAENLEELQSRLRTFACASLQPDQLKPLLAIDVQAHLEQIDLSLYEQIDALHPCGIQNPDPVFWTPNVRVVEQRLIGKDQAHLKVTLSQDVSQVDTPLAAIAQPRIQALAWRWGEYYPLPNRVDIAYKLRVNEWQGNQTVELELVGVRLPSSENALRSPATVATQQAKFDYSDRQYTCGLYEQQKGKELRITNSEGQQLVIQKGQKLGWLLKPGAEAKPVDVSQPFFYQLIKTALSALG
ncbi:single-stranded-DNA-specific exonuclease RecJ [Trichocoleus sp. FACHB-591]|uniref:single-stranded-DNA-specific exonuclease RecJ n=1 Tax=Trichocoleus sp. FACHB-591 TaxID=2692872 RepID=UPI00351C32C6